MCTKTKAKVILVSFNVFFYIAGSAMLGFGTWMKVDPESVIDSIHRISHVKSSAALVSYVAVLFIVIGALTFLVAFLGLCGAYNDKTSVLLAYSCLLVVFMIAEIAAIVILLIYLRRVDDSLQDDQLKNAFENERLFNEATASVWNHIQAAFKCCGILGYTDYFNSTWWSPVKSNASDEVSVPASCCAWTRDQGSSGSNQTLCQADAKSRNLKSKHLYTKGCKYSVYEWIYRHTIAMIALASGIFACELLGSISASSLFLLIRQSDEKGY